MATDRINAGLNAFQQGNIELARQILTEVVKSDPQNDQGWTALASCLQDDRQKKYCMEQALKANPNNLQARQFFDPSMMKEDTAPVESVPRPERHQSKFNNSSTSNLRKQSNRSRKNMTVFQLLGKNLTPAEDEITVRTYHCTSLSSRLLNLKAQGYLVVTNRRVIFHAYGSSYTGASVMQSEIPVEDVSGITHYKGTIFSLSHLLSALAVVFFLSPFLFGVFVGIFSIAIIFFQAFSSILQIAWLALGIIIAISSFSISSKKIWRLITLMAGIVLLNIAMTGGGTGLVNMLSKQGGNFLTNTIDLANGAASAITSVIGALASFGFGIYSLFCIYMYTQRETISLAIGSKGGSSTPIAISGISGFGHNAAAVKALTAEPAADVDTMIKELGAMITDIQSIGNYGVEKWRVD
ncbi:MAG TPA: hypothetical protein PLA27_06220 [Anaerolineales bacterium]|jgi:hypothetical protein|nr:hypothetical protein [Anaerolineales bacterium]